MENYLKEFNTHSDYETFRTSTDFIRPHVSICNLEDDVHYNEYDKDYLTFIALENGTFSFSTNNIDYSLNNGTTWTTLTAGTNTPTVNAGEKIMWKASGLSAGMDNGIGIFSSTGQFKVIGNVMSLVSGDNFSNTTEMTGHYQFSHLFSGCTGLTNAKNLVLPTKLTLGCYFRMFSDCTNLTIAPELLSTTVASVCYTSMFWGCTSLTTAPSILPATELVGNCYNDMFYGCTSLTKAPILPATTMTQKCYWEMFYGCTSLTTAPELPATTLESNCYQDMFYGCTSLTKAPSVLPATTLTSHCYDGMFQGCTSLTKTPELPATTLIDNCYKNMFNGCTNLNYIKAMFTTTPGSEYTSNWVTGVSSSGTFVLNSAATWTTSGDNGVPTGWTIRTASA